MEETINLSKNQAIEKLKVLMQRPDVSLSDIEKLVSEVSLIDPTAGTNATTYLYSGPIIDENGNDKITTNINPLDLIFRKNQEDLEIMVSGTADKIMVKNYKTAGNVEKIEVLNNQYISSSKIDELIQAMSVFGSQHEGISWETALKDKKDDVSLLVSEYYQTNI